MCKTIGILGGMGPSATIDLFQKIVALTPARVDQDHLRIIIYNNPKIPSRAHALDPSIASPLPELIESALILERAGADFIIMPCHTAHIWFEEIKNAVRIPFYSMVEATLLSMLEQSTHSTHIKHSQILLLASESTNYAQLYQLAFRHSPFQILSLTVAEQIVMDQAIKLVKAGRAEASSFVELNHILGKYENMGISLMLAGCTEVPLMFPYLHNEMTRIDPTLILAKFAIEKAMANG